MPRKNAFSLHRLTRTHKPQLHEHLMRLDPVDRRLRFGLARSGTDLMHYVGSIDFGRDLVFGALASSGELLGVAHVALEAGSAELGLSVDRRARRRGVGLALAERALLEAHGGGAREFRFDYAANNSGMHAIAERIGMQVERDGSEAVARRAFAPLPLPALAA